MRNKDFAKLSIAHTSQGFYYSDKKGGIFCHMHNLVPWPGFSFRRGAILDCIQYLPPHTKFIEIGFGTGIITYEFHLKGFICTGYDIEKRSVDIANDIFNQEKKIIDFRNELCESDKGNYDCVGAFEVMEHIEDDEAALRQWRELLKDNGYIIISVPARMKYWSVKDLSGGHVRRYEKKHLENLLCNNGFQIIRMINYGTPFSLITMPLQNIFVHGPNYRKLKTHDLKEQTLKSGINRNREYRFHKFIPHRALYLCTKIQRLFYNSDYGEGYVLVARKN